MARAKKEKRSKGKQEIAARLLEEYDIQNVMDIQDALKDLLGETIENMLKGELDNHLGYDAYERNDSTNFRNGSKPKKVRSSFGEFEIDVPQDREGSFEPQLVPKRTKDISEIEQKIISMYRRGLSTRQISDQVDEIYGFKVSEGMVSDITDRLIPEIQEWQQRPLSSVYPIVFIDAIHFSVRDENIVKKLAAYVILGINDSGIKEVLSIEIGENESSKFWLGTLNQLKHRGVKDILILCADGLSGMKEAIAAAFPLTEYQRCIVHQVRNTLKHVASKDRKEYSKDLKAIYHAPNEQQGYDIMLKVTEKWQDRYPNSMKSWNVNWDCICPIFKFSSEVRKVIYTTNAIESLNSSYRRLNGQRSVFPSQQSLLKVLYLSTMEATKKWNLPVRTWGKVFGELAIMYDGRLS
jgi:transposase-like protein